LVIGELLGADYQPTDNRLVAYRCISSFHASINWQTTCI